MVLGEAAIEKPDLAAVIEGGESEAVEFKSTPRVNLHTGEVDRRLELSVSKTLAGFLNTRGGTLSIENQAKSWEGRATPGPTREPLRRSSDRDGRLRVIGKACTVGSFLIQSQEIKRCSKLTPRQSMA